MKELTNQKTAKLFIRGFLEGISDNNKNIEENIIGFLSKKFLSKIIEK